MWPSTPFAGNAVSACPTLTTERLILRPFEESDLDAYTAIVTSPEVRAALHLPDGFSRADAWTGMAKWLGQWELRGTGQWAVGSGQWATSPVERCSGAPSGNPGPRDPPSVSHRAQAVVSYDPDTHPLRAYHSVLHPADTIDLGDNDIPDRQVPRRLSDEPDTRHRSGEDQVTRQQRADGRQFRNDVGH